MTFIVVLKEKLLLNIKFFFLIALLFNYPLFVFNMHFWYGILIFRK